MKKHLEKNFEDQIEAYLVDNGYRRGHSSDYDRERALLPDEVAGFMRKCGRRRGEGASSVRCIQKLPPEAIATRSCGVTISSDTLI